MKKIFTLVLLFCSLLSFGQLTLITEKESQNLSPIQLSNGTIKFYVTNYYNKSFIKSIDIYNKDLSFYKTINISLNFPYDTTGHPQTYSGLKSIKDINDTRYYLTDKLFNLDDKIEFILNYNSIKYIPGGTSSKYYSVCILLNEDGKEIQKFSNLDSNIEGMSFNFLENLYVNFNNITKVYSVPGNLPCPTSCSQKAAAIAPISQPNEFKKIQVNGFPNPSSDNVTLEYSLPEGTPFGTLRLYSQTGVLVKEFKVSSQVDHLELPVSDYTPGTYYYELQAGGSSSGGKKMVVIH